MWPAPARSPAQPGEGGDDLAEGSGGLKASRSRLEPVAGGCPASQVHRRGEAVPWPSCIRRDGWSHSITSCICSPLLHRLAGLSLPWSPSPHWAAPPCIAPPINGHFPQLVTTLILVVSVVGSAPCCQFADHIRLLQGETEPWQLQPGAPSPSGPPLRPWFRDAA